MQGRSRDDIRPVGLRNRGVGHNNNQNTGLRNAYEDEHGRGADDSRNVSSM